MTFTDQHDDRGPALTIFRLEGSARRLNFLLPVWLGLFGLSSVACTIGVTAPTPLKPHGDGATLSIKELMEELVDPPADVFWSASGTVVTADGEKSRAPSTEAGWEEAVQAANLLIKASEELMSPARALNRPLWLQYSRELGDAARAGLRAARAKNEWAVFSTGGEIYVACRSCHVAFAAGYQ